MKDVEGTEIEAPWGKLVHNKNDPPDSGAMKTIRFALDQLNYFKQKQGETEYLRRDIEGYQILLEMNDPKFCARFLDLKREARDRGEKFRDNLAVIEYMKQGEKHRWKWIVKR